MTDMCIQYLYQHQHVPTTVFVQTHLNNNITIYENQEYTSK